MMADRPDIVPYGDDLVRRLLANMLPNSGEFSLRRAALLKHLCALGSTSATETCRWFGFDPDERVILRGGDL